MNRAQFMYKVATGDRSIGVLRSMVQRMKKTAAPIVEIPKEREQPNPSPALTGPEMQQYWENVLNLNNQRKDVTDHMLGGMTKGDVAWPALKWAPAGIGAFFGGRELAYQGRRGWNRLFGRTSTPAYKAFKAEMKPVQSGIKPNKRQIFDNSWHFGWNDATNQVPLQKIRSLKGGAGTYTPSTIIPGDPARGIPDTTNWGVMLDDVRRATPRTPARTDPLNTGIGIVSGLGTWGGLTLWDVVDRKKALNQKANELFDTNMKTLNDWKPLSKDEMGKLMAAPDKK